MDEERRRKISYAKVVRIIEKADVILEVVDARDIEGTRQKGVEKKVRKKQLVIVAAKADLVADRQPLPAEVKAIYFSAKTGEGKIKLIDMIKLMCRKEKIYVAVVGYPDVGKSSLINRLAERKAAKVGPIAGTTRGEQWISLGRIMLLDSPGVIPLREGSQNLALKCALDADRLYDPAQVAEKIVALFFGKNRKKIFKHFDLEEKECTPEEFVLAVARRRGMLLRGGELNENEAAKEIIRDYQRGKLRL